MDTAALKRFAQQARRTLLGQVQSRLNFVLSGDTAFHRENARTIDDLREEISLTSAESVVERVSYLWFNRFIALRYMDVNNYTFTGILTPQGGHTQPEILQEAKEGNYSSEFERYVKPKVIEDILSGRTPSSNPQQDVYRILIVAACNYYHSLMPFIFEEINDYSELLMPEDLLSDASIINEVRNILTEDTCRDVEVIGWLYQFYISEKKDQVFDDLKKNVKISPENIPAATQLFTPHWIVRYLVENSLGRLWLLNHPGSLLKSEMEYYIEPVDEEKDFLVINSPEELKICDPACGSGHMLTYTFDLLYKIYEEEGYSTKDIPALIIKNNLFGVEIDERAGELAAFALYMKAVEKDRRFFDKKLQPNICVLENIRFEKGDLNKYMDEVGGNLFTMPLQNTLTQFEEAKNFGSLIRPDVTDVQEIISILEEKEMGSNLLLHHIHKQVLRVLHQAEYLAPRYHVVIANPPYMGGKGMNATLRAFAERFYPDTKSDLFAMFIDRNLELTMSKGSISMITMQSWMFLSTYESMRNHILSDKTILSMAHFGPRAFDTIGGEVVSTTAFIIINYNYFEYKGAYLRLIDGNSESEKDVGIRNNRENLYRSSASDFKKIPGSPVAYWFNTNSFNVFQISELLGQRASVKTGMTTADNDRFLRYWYEVSQCRLGFKMSDHAHALKSKKKWFPYNKGGGFRRWYGFNENVINWESDGEEIKSNSDQNGKKKASVRAEEFYFQRSITYSAVSGGTFSARISDIGFLFDSGGSSVFCDSEADLMIIGGIICSIIPIYFLSAFNDTINFQPGDVSRIPIKRLEKNTKSAISKSVESAVNLSRMDWDAMEISWDFSRLSLVNKDYNTFEIKSIFSKLCKHWKSQTKELKQLEEENNRIFIEAYGLQNELTPEVPLEEITLTCNPVYRYGAGKTEEEYEVLLKADTMKEFMSYAVGCMFGRYSLDKPGLILANAGETLKDYLKQVPKPTFMPDEDNVIPLLDGDWFSDDITERFREFLKVTFGEEHYDENLAFIEDAIGKDIRSYFVKDFYNDHIKRYKKRPIYWLFSSPKGSFNAMIYLHRYRPDTVSIVLNEYLREFRAKLANHKQHLEHIQVSANSSPGDKTKATKELDKLKKVMDEIDEYEREILYPLAMQKVELDLDDGVKVNYAKLGKALKAIKGMDE